MNVPRTGAKFFAATELLVVSVLVAATVVSARLLPLTIVAAAIFWPVRWLAYGQPSVRTPIDWPVTLLVLMLPVTLWATALPDTTQVQVYRTLSGIALFYAVANWTRSQRRLRLLVAGTLLAGLGLALAAPFIVARSDGTNLPFVPQAVYDRVTTRVADTVNPNVMAGALVIVLPVVVGVLLFGWRHMRWMERLVVLLSTGAMGVVLVLTQSRGALFALSVALMALFPLRWRRAWLPTVAIAVVGAIGGYILVNTPKYAELVDQLLNQGEARLERWSRAIYMIEDFPFTGIGMGSYEQLSDRMYPILTSSGNKEHAHNLFLQVAVDLGIPGLVAWLAILSLLSIAAWQVYRQGRAMQDRWLAGLGAGLLGSQIALVTHGLFDAVSWGMVRTAVLPWAVWGLTTAAWNLSVRARDATPNLVSADENAGLAETVDVGA